eukprot:3353220-Rhodomonas_salina.2
MGCARWLLGPDSSIRLVSTGHRLTSAIRNTPGIVVTLDAHLRKEWGVRSTGRDRDKGGERERGREIKEDRQIDRQTGRQADRQTDRLTD